MKDKVIYKLDHIITIYTVVMLILKLTGVVNTSWWWIFLPQIYLVSFILICLVIVGIITVYLEKRR